MRRAWSRMEKFGKSLVLQRGATSALPNSFGSVEAAHNPKRSSRSKAQAARSARFKRSDEIYDSF
jgi:hypothetical protein